LAILVLLNNFLHDFSAAGWLFGSVVLWSMLRREDAADQSSRLLLTDMLKTVLLLMRLSLAGIIIFGVVRTLAYKTFEWNVAAGQSQITLLIVKHIILAGIFGCGLFYYIRARKLIGEISNEKKK
jgi:uncharacterized membrane protein